MLGQQDMRFEQMSTLFSWSFWPPSGCWGEAKFLAPRAILLQIRLQSPPSLFGGPYNSKAEYFSEGIIILKFHILHQGNKLKLS